MGLQTPVSSVKVLGLTRMLLFSLFPLLWVTATINVINAASSIEWAVAPLRSSGGDTAGISSSHAGWCGSEEDTALITRVKCGKDLASPYCIKMDNFWLGLEFGYRRMFWSLEIIHLPHKFRACRWKVRKGLFSWNCVGGAMEAISHDHTTKPHLTFVPSFVSFWESLDRGRLKCL